MNFRKIVDYVVLGPKTYGLLKTHWEDTSKYMAAEIKDGIRELYAAESIGVELPEFVPDCMQDAVSAAKRSMDVYHHWCSPESIKDLETTMALAERVLFEQRVH